MEKIKYFEVLRNADQTEGRGPMLGTGIAFKNKTDANRFCSSDHYTKYSVMGVLQKDYADSNNGDVDITVYDSFEEYENIIVGEATLKQNALNKLTKEDKKILGIKE